MSEPLWKGMILTNKAMLLMKDAISRDSLARVTLQMVYGADWLLLRESRHTDLHLLQCPASSKS